MSSIKGMGEKHSNTSFAHQRNRSLRIRPPPHDLTPDASAPAPGGVQQYEPVCECFDMSDAELIATALNAKQATLIEGA